MRRGFEPDWKADERALDHPGVAPSMWLHIDKNKAKHRGWYVLERPTIGQIKSHLSDGLFTAIEADECPVRFTFDDEGREMNFPMGVSEKTIRRLVFESEQDAKKKLFPRGE